MKKIILCDGKTSFEIYDITEMSTVFEGSPRRKLHIFAPAGAVPMDELYSTLHDEGMLDSLKMVNDAVDVGDGTTMTAEDIFAGYSIVLSCGKRLAEPHELVSYELEHTTELIEIELCTKSETEKQYDEIAAQQLKILHALEGLGVKISEL